MKILLKFSLSLSFNYILYMMNINKINSHYISMSKFKEIHNPYMYSSISNNRSTNLYNSLNPYYSNPNSHYFSPHEQISHYNPQFLNQQKIINPLSTYTSYSNQPSPFHMGQISNSCEQDYQFTKRQNPFYRAHLLRFNQNSEKCKQKVQQDKYQQYKHKENQQSFILLPLSEEQRQYNLNNYHKNDLAKGFVAFANKKLQDKLEDQRLNYHKSDLAIGLTQFANKISNDKREQQQRQNYYKNDFSKGLLNFANEKYKQKIQQQQRQNYYKSDLAKGLTNFAKTKYNEQSQISQLTNKKSIIQQIDEKQFGSFGKEKGNNLKKRINQNMKNVSPEISQVQNGYHYFVDSDQDRQSAKFISYANQKNNPAKIYVRGKVYDKIQIN